MNIIKNGSIKYNNKKYKYKIFDTLDLIDLIKHKHKFIESLENTIKLYRDEPNFHILDLVKEFIYSRTNEVTIYFIVYKKNIIISTMRFYYNLKNKSGYFNLVYTNPNFRGQKICQTNIAHMINLTKKYIIKYELDVDIDNHAAIKCYENNGFKKIKKVSYTIDKIKKFNYQMILIIK